MANNYNNSKNLNQANRNTNLNSNPLIWGNDEHMHSKMTRSHYNQPKVDNSQYREAGVLKKSDEFGQHNRIDDDDIERFGFKNRITYDFMTGNDYEKADKVGHMTSIKNQSIGVVDIFDKIKNMKSQDEEKENDMTKFKRDLADARRFNMPYEEAEQLIEVANSIVPPVIYENFMQKNMHNKERIENYKSAIDRRMKVHFDTTRKKRLADLLKKN